MILNLNGGFSSASIRQRKVFIELYSGETIRVSRPRTSLFALNGLELGYRFLNTSSTTQMTQTPSMTIVTIAATRLYRSLTNIYSSDT